VVAQAADGTYILPVGAIPGVKSRPAIPGETIVIYGIGFGPVVPATPPGTISSGQTQLAAALQIQIGGVTATVKYAGLTAGSVGLYQFNIVVPQEAANSLAPITFSLGGTLLPQTTYLAVE
jgi:uncharacterized protein (TIGR03437 family)